MADYVIETNELSVYYGKHRGILNVNLQVEKGEVFGFLGPNGAGKTTTLRVVVGLARPTSGKAEVLGRPFDELDRPAETVGVLLDANTYHPRRTARNHLRWLAAIAGVDSARIDQALENVELAVHADRRVGEFSLGMRQRLGLAAAMLANPAVIVLDEPANGLDPAGIRWLRLSLRDFAARGGTVFVSSHLLAEVAQLADEVVVIDHGRLITHTSVDRLTEGSVATARVRTPHPDALIPLLEGDGAEARVVGDRGVIEVRGMGPDRVGDLAAAAGIALHELGRGTHSLEEIFFELTNEEVPHVGASQG
jgi:ABC-2 type transport system ATP-binding protein